MHCLFPFDRLVQLFRQQLGHDLRRAILERVDVGVDWNHRTEQLGVRQHRYERLLRRKHERGVECTADRQILCAFDTKLLGVLRDKINGLNNTMCRLSQRKVTIENNIVHHNLLQLYLRNSSFFRMTNCTGKYVFNSSR